MSSRYYALHLVAHQSSNGALAEAMVANTEQKLHDVFERLFQHGFELGVLLGVECPGTGAEYVRDMESNRALYENLVTTLTIMLQAIEHAPTEPELTLPDKLGQPFVTINDLLE